jgi:hypothetical protein
MVGKDTADGGQTECAGDEVEHDGMKREERRGVMIVKYG